MKAEHHEYGTWAWYGWRRFHWWHMWLRPWLWVKFMRGPEPYEWRFVVGPFELRKVMAWDDEESPA